MNPCILTGYDDQYEKFAPYWLHCIRKHSDWPVYVCDFGFSEEHKKWLESKEVSVYKATSSNKGWFLKPFAMRDCPARFGVYIDIDAEAMLDLSIFDHWINPMMIGAAPDPYDVHWYQVPIPLNSGIIPFDSKSPALTQWTFAIDHAFATGKDRMRIHEKKGDQGYLNLDVDRARISLLPRKLNWFEHINEMNVTPPANTVIWHHLGPVGKQRLVKRVEEWLLR